MNRHLSARIFYAQIFKSLAALTLTRPRAGRLRESPQPKDPPRCPPPEVTVAGHRTTRDYRYFRCGRSNGGRARSRSAPARHRYPEKMELH
jgi:hypothetical protein